MYLADVRRSIYVAVSCILPNDPFMSSLARGNCLSLFDLGSRPLDSCS